MNGQATKVALSTEGIDTNQGWQKNIQLRTYPKTSRRLESYAT
jgi:hypothetical protein